ncbi:MAG: ribosomal L7Ae/L30e/S12e/Gadd45 family protein [Clostridia bacterium]|nr:ribosomal L7Ae/L30e/S12e/Gadd45 family protein [Clostridia bacterium]
MTQKILTLLGFASKAGKLSFGMLAATESVKRGKSKLLLTALDVSAKSKKEVIYLANKTKVPYMALDVDMKSLSHAVGKSCGIISVNDNNFANSISNEEEI